MYRRFTLTLVRYVYRLQGGFFFCFYARHSPFNIYRHEYGHTVDSQRWGWLYLPVVGLGSLVSQALGLNPRVRHRHEDFWAERRADRLGERYFGKDEWPE